MEHLRALNSKEIKKVVNGLKEQFGEFELGDFLFFRNNGDKVFLLSRKFIDLDMSKLRVNNFGLYFCKEEIDGFRLTVEGAQLVNPKRNVVVLDRQQAYSWMRGGDVDVGDRPVEGYVVLKYGKDILGCGKFKEGKILNSIQKGRRITGVISGDESGIRTVR